jgi:hypothetical protein
MTYIESKCIILDIFSQKAQENDASLYTKKKQRSKEDPDTRTSWRSENKNTKTVYRVC